MLLPDNMHPELSIYYNGSLLLAELKKTPTQNIMDLYKLVKDVNNMSFSTFVLSLDWLYLIEVAEVKKDGVIELCS